MQNHGNIAIRYVIATCVIVTSGCASIINEKTQRINVATSSGEKTEIAIDGMIFEAPSIATVTRAKADRIITTKNPNCTQSTIMPSEVDNVFFINILSPGGVFGSTTDYATEKMWKYQDTVIITCKQ